MMVCRTQRGQNFCVFTENSRYVEDTRGANQLSLYAEMRFSALLFPVPIPYTFPEEKYQQIKLMCKELVLWRNLYLLENVCTLQLTDSPLAHMVGCGCEGDAVHFVRLCVFPAEVGAGVPTPTRTQFDNVIFPSYKSGLRADLG